MPYRRLPSLARAHCVGRFSALLLVLVLASPAPAVDTPAPHFTSDIVFGGAISGPAMTVAPIPAAPAQTSTTFDLAYGPGLSTNPAAKAAFDQAAANWSAYLKNPVSLKVSVDFGQLDIGILGATSYTVLWGDYAEIRDPLVAVANQGSAARANLLSHLPTVSQFSPHLPATGFSTSNAGYITQGNYMGLTGQRLTDSDGSITFSNLYSWDFDPSNGIDPGKFDFVGAAMHEIGHVLGFDSIVDAIDVTRHNGGTFTDVGPYPLDFFRFNPADLGAGFNFTTSPRNLVPGSPSVFYTGTGTIPMSLGYYASGSQASHWADNQGLGIMDPSAAPGERLQIGPNDLVAMDLIGWNVAPEPATLALLAAGTALLLRRRRVRL
jgi:hypothetical protein